MNESLLRREKYSFKVNAALLSRCRVFVLQRLSEDQLVDILSRALHRWRTDEAESPTTTETQALQEEEKEALKLVAVYSDGDGMQCTQKSGKHLVKQEVYF